MRGFLKFDDRSLLGAIGAVALLLAALTIAVGRGTSAADIPTTHSSGSGGARALYLLLQASGYDVEQWERSPDELPTGAEATFVLAEPEAAPTAGERAAVRQFVARGGRVVAAGFAAAAFLPEDRSVPDPITGMTWKRIAATAPSSAARAAPTIAIAPAAYWNGTAVAVPWYGDTDKAYVVTYGYGRGQVVWLAAATPMTNAGLREAGNLEFVLACLGGRHRRILWDEYTHGYRTAGSVPAIDLPVGWGLLQLALLMAAILVSHSRRSGPTIPADVESRLSPLEFVRTLGGLYRRAGAASVAVDVAYHRFVYRLTQRLGVPVATSGEALARLLPDRPGLDASDLARVLARCERGRRDPRLSAAAALDLTRALWRWSQQLDLVAPGEKEIA